MAKTMATILMDYTNAKQQAAKLEDAAARLKRLANSDLEGALNNIGAAWSGDSANLYLQKGRNLKDQILRTAAQIENAAAAIRTTAQNTYNADKAAADLAAAASAAAAAAGGSSGGGFRP